LAWKTTRLYEILALARPARDPTHHPFPRYFPEKFAVIFSLIGLAAIAGGILVIFLRRRSAALQAASVNWPTVEGRVSDAKLHSFRDNAKT
jgi:LPXTG-motif cell wall-anchored protein